MTTRIVLDSSAFDALDKPDSHRLWALLDRLGKRDGEVCCAAVTLAEVCRGASRTKRIESVLVRSHGGHRIVVVPTDEKLAKLVGSILHGAGAGSDMIADAHVVAACAAADVGIVVTSDPDDITRLASSLRGVRVITRAP